MLRLTGSYMYRLRFSMEAEASIWGIMEVKGVKTWLNGIHDEWFSGPDASLLAQVSFLTAALMAVALCFHSILEVRPYRQSGCSV